MKIVNLPKKNLPQFIESLKAFGEVHGPVKKGGKSFEFKKIKDTSIIDITYHRTILPLKKYFLNPIQPVFKFSTAGGYVPVNENNRKKKVLFGVHACDIKALEILDMVKKENYTDKNYFNVFSRITLWLQAERISEMKGIQDSDTGICISRKAL